MTTQTVNYNGQELALNQEPYIDHVSLRVGDTVEVIDGTVYRAAAVDRQGDEYEVYWTCLHDGPDGLEVKDWAICTVLPA